MSNPIVQTAEGKLKGKVSKDVRGKKFYSFEGIPYGEPPIGNLRFKAPVPVKPWEGVKDALEQGPPNFCVNLDFTALKDLIENPKLKLEQFATAPPLSGSEDCLNLNVYTPELPTDGTKLRAVMVYIHGGAFTMGNTLMYGPNFLIAEDVVVVSIHYRLGALGFLALDDPALDVPGNAGLKDMVLALKWVRNNIRNFNGDPDNITIFGESAGAAAVHFLVLSPATKGLFHKAIIQSGSVFNCWAWGKRNNAKPLAQILGCTDAEDGKILTFLQELKVEQVYQGQLQLIDYMSSAEVRNFSPVVEKYPTKESILLEDPMDLLSSGRYNQVPILSGYTSLEAKMFAKELPGNLLRSHGIEREHLPPHFLKLEKGSEKYKEIAERIEKFYFGDKTPTTLSQEGCLLVSDIFFVRGLLSHSKLHAKTSKEPVYLYRMSIESKLQLLPIDEEVARVAKGVPHGADIPYLFSTPAAIVIAPGSIEDIGQRRFCKLWTNFAKFTDPTPKEDSLIPVQWKPVKDGVLNFLDIGQKLTAGVNPEADRMAFWDEIFQSFPHTVNY